MHARRYTFHPLDRDKGRGNSADSGHTLLELMIALALSLLVIAGALRLYQAQREAFARTADAQSMRDAGATALTLLAQHIQMAGFVPPDWSLPRSYIEPVIFGCSNMGSTDRASAVRCAALAQHSDAITVRYVGDTVSTWPSAAGEVTDCLGQRVGNAGEPAVIVNRFFVDRPRAGGEWQLYCEGNGKVRGKQPVVAGIERLAIGYWLRGEQMPLRAHEIAADRWEQVIAVDVCVVVRGAWSTQPTRYTDCDGARLPNVDRHTRETFSRHVVVRNSEAI
ncbi:PilW family protein [Trinickia fusca]|uniref:Type IV pillus assembly protein n=1 Tax=Trinickia fusca TaxID=2419777 RepID=A0A494XK23_9BURK|nr:PilW family protein [Trinickia fusca]RKP50938.1 type IV pillus assembly protein [Trinickia fusca]